MTMPVYATKRYDLNFGFLSHTALWPPAPHFCLVPVTNFSIEMVVPMGWWPGEWLAPFIVSHGIADSVTHQNQGMIQGNHDCGWLIPDLTIPTFLNMFYPLQWLFSSRGIAFNASKIELEGEAAGLTQLIPPGPAPPLPMMTCGDPFSAPTTLTFNFMNRVHLGMRWQDLVAGLIMIAVSIAIDAIFFFMDARAVKKAGADDAAKAARRKALGPGQYDDLVKKETKKALKNEAKSKVGLSGKAFAKWGVKGSAMGAAGAGAGALKGEDPTFRIGSPVRVGPASPGAGEVNLETGEADIEFGVRVPWSQRYDS